MSICPVAYLVPRFPKLSETFIVDEILALKRSGVPVRVYALRPGRTSALSPEVREHVPEARWVGLLSPRLLTAQLYWLSRAPGRLLAVWLLALSRHLGSPRLLARAVLAVSHASVFAIEMRRSGVEHVHAHWATHSALAAWVIQRLAGLTYSFTAHADDIFVRRPMLEEKVRGAGFVVTISEYNRRFLVEQLGDWAASRVRVVRCGVASDDFQPQPPTSRAQPFTIACIARLEPKKGHRVLLDACARLAARGIDFRCVLVGEGAERRAIERQRREAGLEGRVELLGAQSRARVREVLAAAHVVSLPCVVAASGRADGIPVALMEAMALERPVVTTAISGIPELVEDGVSGLLVEPGDAVALADALERIQGDPVLAARLAEAGRCRVREDFDLERNVGRLLRLFERCDPAAPPIATTAVRSRAGAEV